MSPSISPVSSAPSSSWPPSSSEKRRYYAPLTPSPLNPNIYLDETHSSKGRSSPSATLTTQPSSSPKPKPSPPLKTPHHRQANHSASPTQFLLRQKAAAAWRSEALRYQTLSQSQSQLPSRAILDAAHAYAHATISKSHDEKGTERQQQPQQQQQGGWTATVGPGGDAILTITVPEETLLLDGADKPRSEEGGDEESDIGLLIRPVDKRSAGDGGGGGGGDGTFQLLGLSETSPFPSASVTVVAGEPARCSAARRLEPHSSRNRVTMRRVLFVMGLLFGLGLIHCVMRVFLARRFGPHEVEP